MSSKDIATIQSISSDIEQTVTEILHGCGGDQAVSRSHDDWSQEGISNENKPDEGRESEYTLEDLSSLVAGALSCRSPKTSPRSTLDFGPSPPLSAQKVGNFRPRLSSLDENGRFRNSCGSSFSRQGDADVRYGKCNPASPCHQANQQPGQLKGTAPNSRQLAQSGRPAVNSAVKDTAATELGSSIVGDLQISFFKGRDNTDEDGELNDYFVLEVQPLLNSHNMKAVRCKKGMKRSLSASWKPPRPPRKEPLGHSHSFSHKTYHVQEQPKPACTSPSAPLLWELAGPESMPASECISDYWAHICLLLILLSLTFLLLSFA